jgi:NAD-dependent SIR2 family protein deacetylase
MPKQFYSQKHLIDILKPKSAQSKFVLFIGAGASQCSGVELASDMIADWREQLFKQSGEGGDQDAFLRRFAWYDTDDEYSNLFELVYDEPSQRREYIEDCLKDATPSWGYIYLVNLMRKHVFNTIFTTNFDDLLNEACYLYSTEVRPIVCAHDSSIRTIRMTSERPKIIKLHGDFLYDNIKNTVSELETLEANMRQKFKQYASEFGLIVIGYRGADRSVMDTLSLLLRDDTLFQYGVYWCIRKGSNLSPKARSLLQYRRFRSVEIDGFDEFTAQLHSEIGHDLQPELADPYGSLARRLNDLTRKVTPLDGKIDPIIERDIRDIGRKITSLPSPDAKFELTAEAPKITIDIGSSKIQLQLPFGFLARIKEKEGNIPEAFNFLQRQLKQGPNIDDFQYGVRLALKANDEAALLDLIEQVSTLQEALGKDYRRLNDVVLDLINAKRYTEADRLLEITYSWYKQTEPKQDRNFEPIYLLNKLQIKRYKKLDLSPEEHEQLKKCQASNDNLLRYGASVLLESFDEAESTLKEIRSKTPHQIEQIKMWPITGLLRPHLQDPTLKAALTK